MICIYNGLTLRHKKGRICASSSEVDEHRASYTEWSKPGRTKQILYLNAYIWNLEKGYWRAYLQDRNRDTNIEKGLVDTVRKGEGKPNWESSSSSTDMYTTMCKTDSWQEAATLYWEPSSILCDDLERWDGGWEGGSRRRGYTYTYSWFTVLYSRNQHSIVKQLSYN